MSAPTNLKEFCTLLVRSKLMTPDEVKGVVKHYQASGKDERDLDAFRKVLFTNRYLTEYQLALISRGHSDGFFLDQYKILDLVSKGSMTGVYKAIHQSGQTVAIKVLPGSKARDPEALARFRREAKLITKLDHPNMVRAFQLGETGNKNYLVMEFLEGETLQEILEVRKTLPPMEAVRIAHQVMLGLQHLYERGMIHRDINPHNIMLLETVSGRKHTDTLDRPVKILDIGLGKAVFDPNAKSPVDDPSQLTSEGVLLGSPDYLAPEQARKASTADIRSDIYSVGCVLFHMLVGECPFPDQSILNQVMRHATEPPRRLAGLIASVPDGLQNVLDFLMAKDPAQRYSTPDKAAQALQLLVRNLPSTIRPPGPMPEYLKWLRESGTEETSELPAMSQSAPVPIPAPAPISAMTPPPSPTLMMSEPVTPPSTPVPRASTVTTTPTPVPAKPVVPVTVPVGKLEPQGRRFESPKKPVQIAAQSNSEFDVELIDVTPSLSPAYPSTPSLESLTEEPRSLLELNRRDVIMLVIGGAMVVTAILGGYGLSRVLRRTPPAEITSPAPETEAAPAQE